MNKYSNSLHLANIYYFKIKGKKDICSIWVISVFTFYQWQSNFFWKLFDHKTLSLGERYKNTKHNSISFMKIDFYRYYWRSLGQNILTFTHTPKCEDIVVYPPLLSLHICPLPSICLPLSWKRVLLWIPCYLKTCDFVSASGLHGWQACTPRLSKPVNFCKISQICFMLGPKSLYGDLARKGCTEHLVLPSLFQQTVLPLKCSRR